jgi:hypothetical protein
MLEQKRDAAWFYPRLYYTVEGKTYSPPADVEQRIKNLDAELESARDQWKRAQGKAEGSSGLIGALALIEAQGKGLVVAQIEYELAAYRNGFPPLMAPVEPSQLPAASNAPGLAPSGVPPSKPLSIPSEASEQEKEREAMLAALSFGLTGKSYLRSDAHANRYQDLLLMDFEYENKSEKDIRAFTGAVVFSDIFDRECFRVGLTVDKSIAAGKKVRENGRTLEMNQFNDAHKRLIATETENLHVRFEPESILFADGSRLGRVVGATSAP